MIILATLARGRSGEAQLNNCYVLGNPWQKGHMALLPTLDRGRRDEAKCNNCYVLGNPQRKGYMALLPTLYMGRTVKFIEKQMEFSLSLTKRSYSCFADSLYSKKAQIHQFMVFLAKTNRTPT